MRMIVNGNGSHKLLIFIDDVWFLLMIIDDDWFLLIFIDDDWFLFMIVSVVCINANESTLFLGGIFRKLILLL